MTIVSAMPVRAVARIVGEHDARLWRVIRHYVDEARARTDASGVTRLAIDETAARRGQDYVTLFVDIDQARVVFATEGNDAATIAAFADDLAAHGGDPDRDQPGLHRYEPSLHQGHRREPAECEPSPSTSSMQSRSSTDAVDQDTPHRTEGAKSAAWHAITVGCAIRRRCPIASARRSVVYPMRHLKTARAYPDPPRHFQDLYDQPSVQAGASYLKKWYLWAAHQPDRTSHRCRAHRQASLGRHPAMVRQQDRQRPDRGHQ